MSIGRFALPISGSIVEPDEPTSGFRVRYFDPFGNLLKTQYVESGQNATPPTPPVFEHLTFTEWNYPSTNIVKRTDIGAIYDTTDEKSYLFVWIGARWMQPTININKSTTDEMTIDWGDGETSLTSLSGDVTIQKPNPYLVEGDYIIKISCNGLYSFGQTTESYLFNLTVLNKIYFGKNVYSIFKYSLAATYSLRYVSFNSTLKEIGQYAITSSGIRCAVIPASMTNNANYLFTDNKNLATIVLSTGISSLGTSFAYYSGVEEIIIPKEYNDFHNYVIRDCPKLKIFDASLLTITDGVFGSYFTQNVFSLEEFLMPENVTQLPTNLIYGAISLEYITIPSTVTTMYSQCIRDCHALKEVTCMAIVPPSLAADSFDQTYSLNRIWVPDSSVNDYKTATNWIDFADLIHPLSEKP